MFRDFVTPAQHLHSEYLNRRYDGREPAEPATHIVRQIIGAGLIRLGERIARQSIDVPMDQAA